MSDGSRPWWSSGSGPEADVEPGPAAEERARRERERERAEQAAAKAGRGASGNGEGAGTANGTGAPHANGHAEIPHAHGLEPGEVCQVCPICTALRLVGEVRPDLLVHLTEAARHLTLAAKTIIDAQASGFRGGLEHIPLDDDPS